MKDLGSLVFWLLIVLGAFWWFKHSPVTPSPGESAPEDPVQTEVRETRPWAYKDYTIVPLAHYVITARILHRQPYYFDPLARLSPLDLALGWGPLSDPVNYKKLHISQDGRWYEYNYGADFPAGVASRITHCSANTHLIPADDVVRDELLSLRQNQTVVLKGYLVRVIDKTGIFCSSSLSRDDTAGGACEVMWVEEASVLP